MNAKFSQHPGTILREDRLGLFTRSPFLPVHFHWTTTPSSLCRSEYPRDISAFTGNFHQESVVPLTKSGLAESTVEAFERILLT